VNNSHLRYFSIIRFCGKLQWDPGSGEEDNERSVRRRGFGYNPDNGDFWGEYQPAVGDPMFACYLDLHGSTIQLGK
jgi:hypothetical protein